MFGISWWYCCLNPREAGVLRAVASYMTLTLQPYVPLDVFDGFCASFGLTASAMRAAFVYIYQLQIATIVVDPELPPIEVVEQADPILWAEWLVYFMSSASLCSEGCQQSKLPWQSI